MVREGGFAFLRKSHGGCNSPPDCCQEPPFESTKSKKTSFRLSNCWWGKVDSLFCGKATAVATVPRTVAKSRLSNPQKSKKTSFRLSNCCDVSTKRCVNAGCLHQKLLQNNLILLTQTSTSIRGNNSIMLKTSCYHAGVNTNTSSKGDYLSI